MQSAEELALRVFRVAGKLRPDDGDARRVPAEDAQRAENQPDAVHRQVGGGARQPVAERAAARLGGVTARRLAGERPVGSRHAHAQRATGARRVNGRVAQVRPGNRHATVVDFQIDAGHGDVHQRQRAGRRGRVGRRRGLTTYRRPTGSVCGDDRQRVEGQTLVQMTLEIDAPESVRRVGRV